MILYHKHLPTPCFSRCFSWEFCGRSGGADPSVRRRSSAHIRFCALFALGNIANGNSGQIQAVLDAGELTRLIQIVRNRTREPTYVVKEATHTLTNMIRKASSAEQTQFIVADRIISALLSMLKTGDSRKSSGNLQPMGFAQIRQGAHATNQDFVLGWKNAWSQDICKLGDAAVVKYVAILWNQMAPRWARLRRESSGGLLLSSGATST